MLSTESVMVGTVAYRRSGIVVRTVHLIELHAQIDQRRVLFDKVSKVPRENGN